MPSTITVTLPWIHNYTFYTNTKGGFTTKYLAQSSKLRQLNLKLNTNARDNSTDVINHVDKVLPPYGIILLKVRCPILRRLDIYIVGFPFVPPPFILAIKPLLCLPSSLSQGKTSPNSGAWHSFELPVYMSFIPQAILPLLQKARYP